MDVNTFSAILTDLHPQIIRHIINKQSDALGDGKITIPQFIVLHLLDSSARVKMRDIAGELNITFPSATSLVNRLYGMGLVKRKADAMDRRVVYIELTPKGRSTVQNISARMRKKSF